DPPKMGIYPDSTAVFDLDSIGLVTCTNLLNRGLDFARRPLNGQTSFVLGVGCNPGATDLEREIRRYEQKVEAGAEFVFSQPVYDNALLENFLKRTAHVRPIPFFVGILPLASYKNAEFLHNEVPGMQIPEEIRERMRLAQTRDAQRNEGMQIAAEVLREARRLPQVQGAYIFPPFGKYERIMDVLELAGV
ncbi:MAG TPA: methylenetetrahydrofolate reductase, partial [bacterium]|nr:methylenetetrahydrofolate reductase [bacterium]